MRVSPLLALVVILFCAGCSAPRAPPALRENITDDLGHAVSVQVPVRRVVSLSPAATEVVGALGRTDRIIGRCDTCNWPPQVLTVPAVGGSRTFRVETVASLRPDLVLATPREDPERLEELRAQGYPVLVFAPETVEGIYGDIYILGDVLGEQANASSLVRDLRTQEEVLRNRTSHLPKVKAVYVHWDDPLYVAGNGTYENVLITATGGINLYGNSTGYVMASEEDLTRKKPDVIIVPGGPSLGTVNLTAGLQARPGLAGIPAVKNHRICTVDADIASRPGPRVIQAMKHFSACLHPPQSVNLSA